MTLAIMMSTSIVGFSKINKSYFETIKIDQNSYVLSEKKNINYPDNSILVVNLNDKDVEIGKIVGEDVFFYKIDLPNYISDSGLEYKVVIDDFQLDFWKGNKHYVVFRLNGINDDFQHFIEAHEMKVVKP